MSNILQGLQALMYCNADTEKAIYAQVILVASSTDNLLRIYLLHTSGAVGFASLW
jgi:hypothetical protein